VLTPLAVDRLVIGPEIVTSEIMVIESVAIVTGKIANVGDIEFDVGQVSPWICGVVIYDVVGHV
jgi:hypothetical protein